MSNPMTTKQAAKYLGISYQYLRNMRHLCYAHDGPVFTVGPKPRKNAHYYKQEDLDKWKVEHKWRKSK